MGTEVVLHDSKIRSQNVHFHESFWREQNLAATKLFLSLTRMDFAVGLSNRAVRVLPALSLRRVRPSYGTFCLMVFQGNCGQGRTGHMINIDYFIESATYGFLFTGCKTLKNSLVRCAHSFVFQSFSTSE